MASHLLIHDLSAGTSREVLSTDRLIEAPNWTRDGAALIVNAEGRLWRVALDAPGLETIDTGPLDRLNNDHGLSPDGSLIVVSNHDENRKSVIWTLPAAGGTPTRITPNVPSWWHGWSPDGARIAYAAARGQGVAIATCALDGSDERVLTEGFDHCDGPDYSADGRWIWFNGERQGRVCLWRMRPDGSGLERMSGDERIHWFPHPSPDGRHVVYLAYPPGTEGHPFGRDVELRLMPQDGGAPKVIERFWGGQGTINVPSWAPDASAFAYVAYDK